jgi:hypothetical protein
VSESHRSRDYAQGCRTTSDDPGYPAVRVVGQGWPDRIGERLRKEALRSSQRPLPVGNELFDLLVGGGPTLLLVARSARGSCERFQVESPLCVAEYDCDRLYQCRPRLRGVDAVELQALIERIAREHAALEASIADLQHDVDTPPRPDPLEVITRLNAFLATSRTLTALLAQALVEFTAAADLLQDDTHSRRA